MPLEAMAISRRRLALILGLLAMVGPFAIDSIFPAFRALAHDLQVADAAIQQTRTFFESLGLPTRLSAYQLGADAIDALINQLAAHRLTALGEHNDVNLDVSRQVLEASL